MGTPIEEAESFDRATEYQGWGNIEPAICQLCNRYPKRSLHHLVPREARALDLPPELKKRRNHTIRTCRGCHTFIHKTWTNEYLAYHLNTLELILATPEFQHRLRRIQQFGPRS